MSKVLTLLAMAVQHVLVILGNWTKQLVLQSLKMVDM